MKPDAIVLATTAASAAAGTGLAATPAILTAAGFGVNGLVATSSVAALQSAGAVGAIAAAGPVAIAVGASVACVAGITAAGFWIAAELVRHGMGKPGKLDKSKPFVVAAEVPCGTPIFFSHETKKSAKACMARGRAVRRILVRIHWPSNSWLELETRGWNALADGKIRNGLRKKIDACR